MILVLIFSLITACANKPAEPNEEEHVYGKIIYVSPDGNDENSGEKDTPVASLTGAVNAMRSYRKQNGLPEGGIKIEFASGTYNVTEGITLTAEDSGTEESPIVFAGADGADVLLSGGVTLDPADFQPADDAFKSLLQTEEAKQNVVMIDLAAAGCYDLYETNGGHQELFSENRRLTIARWPNDTYCNPEINAQDTVIGKDGGTYVRIPIPTDKAELWKDAKKISFYGMPYIDWQSITVYHIQTDDENPSLLFPSAWSNINNECLYFLFNIPQELDSPGEYYWDSETRHIYYWPVENPETSQIAFSQLNENCFTLTDCSYISFSNFSAKYFRQSFFKIVGNHITVENCGISCCAGDTAIDLTGDSNTVKGCLLHDLSTSAIIVHTGDIASQTIGNTLISDNIIHDWSQLYTTFNAGIDIYGYGACVCHNELYNSPHLAIALHSGECLVEYNDVHDCCKETSDSGALYTWGRFSWSGNIFRYNYVHQIYDRVSPAFGITRLGNANGIYFDWYGRFSQVYGNLFVDIVGTAVMGAAGHTLCENNICINVGETTNIFTYGLNDQKDYYDCEWMTGDIRLYDYLNGIWKYTSPRTLLFVELNDQSHNKSSYDLPLAPAYSVIRNNVRYIDPSSSFKPFPDTSVNEYYKYNSVRGDDHSFAMDAVLDNVCYINDDPGFTDYANGDYTLKKDSRVFRDLIGFEEPDLSTVGVRASENPFK